MSIASACSGGSDKSGSSVSLDEDSSTEVDAAGPATTATADDLASLLEGEPPATTVSTDASEQAAADAVHWSFQTFDRCLANTMECDVADFEATDSGPSLQSFVDRFAEYEAEGIVSAPDAAPSEHVILWARKSIDNKGVVGVLECQRNYYISLDSEDLILDDSSETALVLTRVVLGEDGRWRVNNSEFIDRFQSIVKGQDSCSNFDGSEVSDEVFAETTR